MTHGLAVRCLSCRWPVAAVRSWGGLGIPLHPSPRPAAGTPGVLRDPGRSPVGLEVESRHRLQAGTRPWGGERICRLGSRVFLSPQLFPHPKKPVIGTRRSTTNAGRVPEQVLGERGLSCPPPGPQLRSTRRRPGGMSQTEPRAGGRCPGRGGPQVPAAALRPGSLRGPQR